LAVGICCDVGLMMLKDCQVHALAGDLGGTDTHANSSMSGSCRTALTANLDPQVCAMAAFGVDLDC